MTKEKEFSIACPELPKEIGLEAYIVEVLNIAILYDYWPWKDVTDLLSFYGDSWGYYE